MRRAIDMEWQTAKEAGYRLGVCAATVSYWGRMGLIPVKAKNQRVKWYAVPTHPRHAGGKLTTKQVLWIRANGAKMTKTKMARTLGVSRRTVNDVLMRRTWATE